MHRIGSIRSPVDTLALPTIYLQCAATGYGWVLDGIYYSIIVGDGRMHRLHNYALDLPGHTWRRNIDAVEHSCLCMGGQPDPWSISAHPRSSRDALPGGGSRGMGLGLGC